MPLCCFKYLQGVLIPEYKWNRVSQVLEGLAQIGWHCLCSIRSDHSFPHRHSTLFSVPWTCHILFLHVFVWVVPTGQIPIPELHIPLLSWLIPLYPSGLERFPQPATFRSASLRHEYMHTNSTSLLYCWCHYFNFLLSVAPVIFQWQGWTLSFFSALFLVFHIMPGMWLGFSKHEVK